MNSPQQYIASEDFDFNDDFFPRRITLKEHKEMLGQSLRHLFLKHYYSKRHPRLYPAYLLLDRDDDYSTRGEPLVALLSTEKEANTFTELNWKPCAEARYEYVPLIDSTEVPEKGTTIHWIFTQWIDSKRESYWESSPICSGAALSPDKARQFSRALKWENKHTETTIVPLKLGWVHPDINDFLAS